MEALHHPRRCGMSALHGKVQLRRRWWVTIGAAVGIVIILVIVIPLAILLPQRSNNDGEPSSVIFPLYIYPETNSTWDPLYEVIATHPDLNFLVVVNPQSGPGSLAHPGEEYQGAIRQLARYPNVQSVGYVPIRYSERQIAEVLDDIATYSGWHAQSAELAMAGIFFDESPHQYSDEAFNYLTRIARAVKEAPGLQRDQTVILNPGTIPDARLAVPNTDITVVFEQSYDHYETSQKAGLQALDANRDATAYIFHSVPSMSSSRLARFVEAISTQAAYLYLTTRTDRYYEIFDTRLAEFCDSVPT